MSDETRLSGFERMVAKWSGVQLAIVWVLWMVFASFGWGTALIVWSMQRNGGDYWPPLLWLPELIAFSIGLWVTWVWSEVRKRPPGSDT
jgi:hypothetical protein